MTKKIQIRVTLTKELVDLLTELRPNHMDRSTYLEHCFWIGHKKTRNDLSLE